MREALAKNSTLHASLKNTNPKPNLTRGVGTLTLTLTLTLTRHASLKKLRRQLEYTSAAGTLPSYHPSSRRQLEYTSAAGQPLPSTLL